MEGNSAEVEDLGDSFSGLFGKLEDHFGDMCKFSVMMRFTISGGLHEGFARPGKSRGEKIKVVQVLGGILEGWNS